MNFAADARLIQINLNMLGATMESHRMPRVRSSHFWPVMLIASSRSPGFMRALAAAEPGCDRFGDDALRSIDPGDAVPRLVPDD